MYTLLTGSVIFRCNFFFLFVYANLGDQQLTFRVNSNIRAPPVGAVLGLLLLLAVHVLLLFLSAFSLINTKQIAANGQHPMLI